MSVKGEEDHDNDEIITIEFEEPPQDMKNMDQNEHSDYQQRESSHYQGDVNPPSNSSDESIAISMLPRSKPGRKTDQERENDLYQRRDWNDDEITQLIRLWKENDVLYNTRHPMYYVQTERKKAMDIVVDQLGIHMKDVNDKMHSLRTYYCSQRQRTENANNGMVSRWKFYNQMSFLYESVTNRANRNSTNRPGRKRYRPEEDYTMSRPVSQVHTYPAHHSPIYDDYNARTPQEEICRSSMLPPRIENTNEKDINKNSHLEFDDTSRLSNVEVACSSSTSQKNTADEMFLQMVASQLTQISEGQEKEKLKLDIQTMIFNTRFKTQ